MVCVCSYFFVDAKHHEKATPGVFEPGFPRFWVIGRLRSHPPYHITTFFPLPLASQLRFLFSKFILQLLLGIVFFFLSEYRPPRSLFPTFFWRAPRPFDFFFHFRHYFHCPYFLTIRIHIEAFHLLRAHLQSLVGSHVLFALGPFN